MSMLCRPLVIVAAFAAVCSSATATSIREGTLLFAYWEEDGFWYPAEAEEFDGDHVHVRFLDDGTRKVLPIGQVGDVQLEVGNAVEANSQNRGEYYRATIIARDGQRYVVRYDEDGVEERVTVRQLRTNLLTQERPILGRFVFGWRSSDGYWYPGCVERIDGDRFRIRFEDDSTASLPAEHVSVYSVEPDDWIEVSQSPRKRYLRALVTVRRGSTLYVEYEDGSTEKVHHSRVRVDLGEP